MKNGLILVSIFLIVMSFLGMIESSKLHTTVKMGVEIGFLPFWMSAIIGLLALLLLINILRGKLTVPDKAVFPKENFHRMIFLVVSLTLYIFLIDRLGYLISTFLFLFTAMYLLRRDRIVKIIFTSSVFSIALYAIFKLWLKSPLPVGFLGI